MHNLEHAGGLNLLLNITTDCDIADETPIYDAGVLANVAKECSSDPDCYLLLSVSYVKSRTPLA